MFRGPAGISIDSKGRVAIPARFRDALLHVCRGQLVCTIDLYEPCLLLYPLNEWEAVEAKLSQFSDMVPSERVVKNLLLGHARELEMDGNGRLLLPPELRTHAKLDKKAMLVGRTNKFQIWDEEAWQQQTAANLELWRNGELAISERLQSFSL